MANLNAPVFFHLGLEFSIGTNDYTGNIFWVLTESASSPSASQIINGLDHEGNPPVFAASYNVTIDPSEHNGCPPEALSANTSYWIHAVQLLGDDVTQSNIVSAKFITGAMAA